MPAKKTLLFEIAIAGFIILILCALMLPRFLQSQRSGAPYRLIKNLQILVEAIKEYQNDYGGMPGHLIGIHPERIVFNPAIYESFEKSLKMEDIRLPFQFFYENGYINVVPDFSEFDEFLITTRNGEPLPSRLIISQMINIWGYARTIGTNVNETKNLCIFFSYPKTEIKDLIHFTNYISGNQISIVSDLYLEEKGSWMNPKVMFSPTNGLHSAGYIYVDSEGNHSPWK